MWKIYNLIVFLFICILINFKLKFSFPISHIIQQMKLRTKIEWLNQHGTMRMNIK